MKKEKFYILKNFNCNLIAMLCEECYEENLTLFAKTTNTFANDWIITNTRTGDSACVCDLCLKVGGR